MLAIRVPEHMSKPPPLPVISRLHRHLDLIGFILITGATVQLLVALNLGGNKYEWFDLEEIALFTSSVAFFYAYVLWAIASGDKAIVPIDMPRAGLVWFGALTMGALTGTMFIQSYMLPIYFQAILDASPTMSGVYLLPSILSQLLFGVMVVVLGKFVRD